MQVAEVLAFTAEDVAVKLLFVMNKIDAVL